MTITKTTTNKHANHTSLPQTIPHDTTLNHYHITTQHHRTETECVYGRIRLECPPLHTIKITSVQLADSRCYRSNCCPAVDDCAKQPSDQHRSMVFSLCNGSQTTLPLTISPLPPINYLTSSTLYQSSHMHLFFS